MKVYLDTAELEDIRKYSQLGIVEGITTNPSIIAKTGVDVKQRIVEICNIVDVPVSAEVSALTTDAKDMVQEGIELSKLHKNIVVKIPMTTEGLKATAELTKLGIKTNVTLIFSLNQALLAAKAGATYVSPFVGRLDDINEDGISLIRDIKTVFEKFDIKSEIIAASIRNSSQFQQSLKAGAHIATVPPSIIDGLTKHPLTTSGINRFKEDHIKVFGE